MDDKAWFASAATGFLEVLPGLATRLDDPGLGSWSIRSLLGHATRAFITLETYLAAAAETAAPVEIDSAADYFRTASQALADPGQVAERGRQAGIALGDEPLEAARAIVDSVTPMVATLDDRTRVATPVGVMTVAAYLPTRAFEVSVHTLDLARASKQEPPAATMETLESCLSLTAALGSPAQRLTLLLAATGRASLDGDISVL